MKHLQCLLPKLRNVFTQIAAPGPMMTITWQVEVLG